MKVGRVSLIVGGVVFASLLMSYHYFTSSLPEPETLVPLSVKMTFSDGTPFYIPRSSWIRIDDVPERFLGMLLASEDRKFFSHIGIDIKGILRALLTNVRRGEVVQGGSTITQQLARTLYLGHNRTLMRKIREVFIALWLERIRTKEEILEMYVNSVYMGNGVYGFQTASLYYFGKGLKELNEAEMASLIATIRSPERFNPKTDLETNVEKARVVLKSSLNVRVLEEGDYRKALEDLKGLRVVEKRYAVDEEVFWRVVKEVEELTGMNLNVLRNGYTVVTTLDRDLQSVVSENLKENMACEAIDSLGRILAYRGVGVRHGSRQPGSLVKPFYYLLAILDGARPHDLLLDLPVKIGEWTPENFSRVFRVVSTLEDALVFSRNVPSVYLFSYLGKDRVENFMRSVLKIDGRYPHDATLALGTVETAPEQILKFYTALMSGGVVLEPSIVEYVLDPSGNVVYSFSPRVLGRIPDGFTDHYRALGILKRMMEEVVRRGTAFRAGMEGLKILGKTGTSKVNAWFVGGNDEFTMAIVADGKDLLGGRNVAPIWKRIVKEWGKLEGSVVDAEYDGYGGRLLVDESVLRYVDYERVVEMIESGELDLGRLVKVISSMGEYSEVFLERLSEIDTEVASSLMEVIGWRR